MEKFVIVADSTSDIPKELRDKYNIEIIPLYALISARTFIKMELNYQQLNCLI